MKKALYVLLFFLVFANSGSAQRTEATSLVAASTDCSTAGSCATLILNANDGSLTVTISGTFVGTAQFEATNNNAAWVSVTGDPVPSGAGVTSATATGTWVFNVAGMGRFRVRASAFTSGSIDVFIRSSMAVAKRFSSLSASNVTVGGMTAGSVLFAGTGGLLSQDNAKLFWDDSNNRFYLGGASSIATNQGVNAPFQIQGISAATSWFTQFRFSADASAIAHAGLKSRGATVGTHAVVQNGDGLYTILAEGSDGDTFERAAAIEFESDGVPADGQMPGRIQFLTSPSGATATPALGGQFRATGFFQLEKQITFTGNCADPAGDADCGSNPSGAIVVDATDTTTVVSTTAVTANSQIYLQRDNSLGTRLGGITCNTQSSLILGQPYVSARTDATSFTVTLDVAPTANPMCINYVLVN